MWQRKQTLFLVIAILLNSTLYFIDLAVISSGDFSSSFNMYGADAMQEGSKSYSTIYLALITAISMLLSLVAIALFKKRQIQIKIVNLNLLLQIATVIALFFFSESAMETLTIEGPSSVLAYEFGAYLSIIPLFFIYLAIRFIKKDEALVRAADRIR